MDSVGRNYYYFLGVAIGDSIALSGSHVQPDDLYVSQH